MMSTNGLEYLLYASVHILGNNTKLHEIVRKHISLSFNTPPNANSYNKSFLKKNKENKLELMILHNNWEALQLFKLYYYYVLYYFPKCKLFASCFNHCA